MSANHFEILKFLHTSTNLFKKTNPGHKPGLPFNHTRIITATPLV